MAFTGVVNYANAASMYGTSSDSSIGVHAMDGLLSKLASECNRHVLRYFVESSEDVASLTVLAEHVTARGRNFDSSDGERVAIRLHHVSLPTLAESDLVEYDPERKTVTFRGHPLLAELLTSSIAAYERRS